MRRAVSLLLSAALLLGLMSACQTQSGFSPPTAPAADVPVTELATAAFEHCGREDSDGLEAHWAENDPEWLAAYIESAYGIQDPWADAAILRATGASAFEVAVLRLEDEASAARAAAALETYLDTRQGDFAGYAPAEADMVASGSVMQLGTYVGLFICPSPADAQNAAEARLRGDSVQALATVPPDAVTGVRELREILVSNTEFAQAELTGLDDPEPLAAYIQEAYGLTRSQWDECSIVRDIEGSAFEIAVFRFLAGEEAQPDADGEYEAAIDGSGAAWERTSAVEHALNDYLNAREAQFDSESDQAKLLHQAITISSGDYVVLLACPDAEHMAGVFAEAAGTHGYSYSQRYRYLDTDEAFPDRCAFTAPNQDDMSLYGTSAIRAAWDSQDPSGLSDYDRKIYDAAEKVLNKVIKNGMSDYEKEAAVYEWIVKNVNYDWTHQNRMKETPRESFTPYGGLVNHTAVCLGYATTFQLLMDLCGVECITVPGAAFSSREDHGWNMVRLNGQWYCVDATWDANRREAGGSGRQSEWNYFNVTSDYMALSDHQWDYVNTPEATAEDQGRD